MKFLTKHKHFKSKTHTSIMNSILMIYIFLKLNLAQFDKEMRKYVNSYNKRFEEYDVRCIKFF